MVVDSFMIHVTTSAGKEDWLERAILTKLDDLDFRGAIQRAGNEILSRARLDVAVEVETL